MTTIRPPEDFDLWKDGRWGRPFTVSRHSTDESDTYGADIVWQEVDGTLHIWGTVDQESDVAGTMTGFFFTPSVAYAPGDWEFEYIQPE